MRLLMLIALTCLLAACQKPASQSPDNGSAEASNWSGPSAPAPIAGEGTLPAGKLDRSHAGTPAPASTFQDPSGKPARIGDFSGKPLLVNLWATWCGPCIIEMPTIDALAKREAGKLQVVVISQDIGDGARAKVDGFFADHKFHQLKPYIDSKMDLMSALKVEVLPTTILYGSDGKEIWRITGIEDWESEDAARLLAEAK